MIPQRIKDSLDRYTKDRVPTGDFLRACLANDLSGACGRADSVNRHLLCDIVIYIHNEMTSLCHGSYEAVDAWLAGPPKAEDEVDETLDRR